MRNPNCFFLLSLNAFFCFFVHYGAICGAAEPSELTIGQIHVVGNRSVTDEQVLSKVRSRVGQLFDSTIADEDAKRIAELTGVDYCYYSTALMEQRVELTFVVVERNIVRAIVFVGNDHYKSQVLRKKLDFELGDYLDALQVRAGTKAVAEFYRKKGFAFADVALDSDKLSEGRVIYRINEGPRVKVEAVEFSGNSAIKTKDLKKVVKTKKKRFLVLTRYYVEEEVAKDVEKLQRIYYDRGYLNNKITVQPQFNQDKSKVRLVFQISEGSAYIVEDILLLGNTRFDEKELREKFKLERAKIYNERNAAADVKMLLKRYREDGFIEAKVEKKRLFVGADKVNVQYEIEPGQRFRIGRINITGNKETQDKVVRHVLDEYDFQPGKWYNGDMARGDGTGYLEKLVRRMAVTEAATITPTGQVPGQRDAQVNITEGQTGLIMLGAGVASDSGVIGQLIFEQRNFDIKDRPKSLKELITGKAFKGAGQTVRIALEPGTEQSAYSVSFTEPYFKDKPISLDLLGRSFIRGQESYDEQRTKGFIGLEKRYKNHWRRSLGFRAENVDVSSIDYDAPKEVRDDKGKNMLFGLRLGVAKDMRDDIFNPTSGYRFDAGYEQVGGDHTFGILDAVYRHYRTVHEDLAELKTVLAVKLLGAIILGDAPVFEKFYAGGTGYYGIRGFQYRGVSPRGLQTNVDNPDRKDPIGGDWIVLANAELTIPLGSEVFNGLVFVDSGTVDSGSYRAAAGVGVQILIPQWFGPVPMRFEIAAPFMKDSEDETQTFSFSVGRLF